MVHISYQCGLEERFKNNKKLMMSVTTYGENVPLIFLKFVLDPRNVTDP